MEVFLYRVEPNTTRNRATEFPFLVMNTAIGKINRYCSAPDDANFHATRLNAGLRSNPVEDGEAAADAEPEAVSAEPGPQTFALF